MPHVILRGRISLKEIWSEFSPRQDVTGARVQNYMGVFMRSDEEQLLYRCLTVDLGVTQNFFLMVDDKGGSYTVKCVNDPHLEKGPVLQEMIVSISKELMAKGLVLEKTNISEFETVSREESE
ncbi:MAG: hypothetical protein H8E43_04690 [Planctomycetia bacterium]|nr:hypothetical protein [Planctomycetia bacterium]MBL6915792.1 hypothetical protein [Planctomycetota bacterium]HCW44122.1 hypothetical protein [Planctomycetota bacterium]